jgi:hypothetical protein
VGQRVEAVGVIVLDAPDIGDRMQRVGHQGAHAAIRVQQRPRGGAAERQQEQQQPAQAQDQADAQGRRGQGEPPEAGRDRRETHGTPCSGKRGCPWIGRAPSRFRGNFFSNQLFQIDNDEVSPG